MRPIRMVNAGDFAAMLVDENFPIQMDYSKYFTPIAAARKPSSIRALQKYLNIPGMITFGGGLPNPNLFPFDSLTINLKDGSKITLSDAETNTMLQYGSTKGYAPLLEFLRQLVVKVHKPSIQYDISIGCGSQDLITRTLEAILDTDDVILIEEPTYVGVLTFLKPLPIKVLGVKTDEFGIIPESLVEVLSSSSRKPKCLYTVPVSANPSGVTTSLERKQRIYDICAEHEILILEDDPYYYLQYSLPLPKSYLSMDTRGLVVRFDSFSKLISGGARVGFMTAPAAIVERVELHKQCTDLQPSGVPQTIVYKLLEKWGVDGFFDHTRTAAAFYQSRCELFCTLLDKYLGDKVEYTLPTSGMFVWLKLKNVTDSSVLINSKAREAGVILLPGKDFYIDERVNNYCRVSFSVATDEQMETGLKRLAALL